MRKLIFLFLISIHFLGYSQMESDKKLDSLMQKFSVQKDSEKAATAKKIGSYYKNNSQYYKAIEYQQIARDLFDSDSNLSIKEKEKNKALCDINIGAEYFFIGDHKKAMDYYIKAYKVLPQNIDLLLNMEGVFSSQNNYEKAFFYAEKAMEVAHKTKDNSDLDRIWSIKSDIYFSKKDSIKAFDALEKSIEFSKKEKDFEQLAITYTNYGDLLKDSNRKMDYYLKSKALWDQYQPNSLLAISNSISIANFYRAIADDEKLQKENQISKDEALNKAEKLLLEQVNNCKKIKHRGKNLQYSLECLSYVYESKKEYKNANDYFKECVILYDSLNSIDTKNKILNVESSFKIGEKDKEIQLNQRIIEQEKKQKWFYLFGIGLLAIIGGLLFYQSRNRKKTNEKLQLLNAELDQANKTKTRFFSILNHDLRSPVANLIHFLHLQKDSPELLDEETKNRMQNKTISGAEDLLSSMEDILLWSKGQMENFKPQPQEVFINQLFEDTKKVFSGYQKIAFEYENYNNISVFTDENYLKTIVRNLTSNAINVFTNTENPKIIWKAWQENGNSFMSITDNGPGASKEQFKALYDDKEVVGIKTGLGLHLIRDLAKAIDCEIKVTSVVNQGTTFELFLPKK
ncbi:HAMP domain-containing sensor histidine kinase [Flavobacterium sp.]|uniref:tetratricopeptide repeat-containing sensor histidine kinase n=1 Tax=Flavobacterium sp. TaxID=239 RepID=UPI002634BD1C|nr:HAMP domain-containing sensor histidine kinase [Flavobacterium sp.]